ncbi:hypothetical protein ACM66B_007088 [Microbotryomycetes sp. NB124-2]
MTVASPPLAYIPPSQEPSWTAFSSPAESPATSRAPSPTWRTGRNLTTRNDQQSVRAADSVTPSRSSSQAPLVSLQHIEAIDAEEANSNLSMQTRSGSVSKDPSTHPRSRHNRPWQSVSWWQRILPSLSHRSSRGEREPQEQQERGRRMNVKVTSSSHQDVTEQPGLVKHKKRHAKTSQLVVAFAMISLVGMNDSATGANLESMKHFYDVSESKISLVFLANVAGYFVSSISTSFLVHHLGMVYSLWVACLVFAAGAATLAVAPPFGAFISGLVLLGFGGGLLDACLTTVVSHDEDQVLLSILYSCFGIGALVSPILIGTFIDRGISWNKYYWVPLGLSIGLAVASHVVFHKYQEPTDDAHNATNELPLHPIVSHGSAPTIIRARHNMSTLSVWTRFARILRMPITWVGAVLIIAAFGTLDMLSAWLVTYQTRIRGSPAAASRYQLSGLWAGIAVGRVLLAWALGNKLGERSFAIVLLAVASTALGACYVVKQYIGTAVLFVVAGMFMGPVTPRVLSSVGDRVPPSLKVTAMSIMIAFGLGGSAIAPLFFGFAVDKGFLTSLPGVLIVSCAIAAGFWSIVPRNRRRED